MVGADPTGWTANIPFRPSPTPLVLSPVLCRCGHGGTWEAYPERNYPEIGTRDFHISETEGPVRTGRTGNQTSAAITPQCSTTQRPMPSYSYGMPGGTVVFRFNHLLIIPIGQIILGANLGTAQSQYAGQSQSQAHFDDPKVSHHFSLLLAEAGGHLLVVLVYVIRTSQVLGPFSQRVFSLPFVARPHPR